MTGLSEMTNTIEMQAPRPWPPERPRQVCRRTKWKWLQPIIAWLYVRVSEEQPPTEPEQRLVIDRDKVIDHIKDIVFSLMSYNITPTKVYMGFDEFHEMCTVESGPFPIPIRFDVDLYYKVLRTPKILGLKIHVIPWMKGILVTP